MTSPHSRSRPERPVAHAEPTFAGFIESQDDSAEGVRRRAPLKYQYGFRGYGIIGWVGTLVMVAVLGMLFYGISLAFR